jgi:hypothetical protein
MFLSRADDSTLALRSEKVRLLRSVPAMNSVTAITLCPIRRSSVRSAEKDRGPALCATLWWALKVVVARVFDYADRRVVIGRIY